MDNLHTNERPEVGRQKDDAIMSRNLSSLWRHLLMEIVMEPLRCQTINGYWNNLCSVYHFIDVDYWAVTFPYKSSNRQEKAGTCSRECSYRRQGN